MTKFVKKNKMSILGICGRRGNQKLFFSVKLNDDESQMQIKRLFIYYCYVPTHYVERTIL